MHDRKQAQNNHQDRQIQDKTTDSEQPQLEAEALSSQPGKTGAPVPPGLPKHPTNRRLRQAAVLQMQRRFGNAFVRRQMGAQTPSLPAKGIVQRGNGDTTAEPTEFIPSISADPPDRASLRFFEHHIHTWEIDNRETAPDSTYFHWGWGLDGDDILELIDHYSENDGATKHVWVQARKPGNTRIQGTPVHQVPGGPRMTGDTRYAPVVVQQPTLRLLSTMPRKADGSEADGDHLSVGDKLIVRVEVGNVDGEHMEDPNVYSVSGEGHDKMTPSELTPVQEFPDGKSYDAELTANAPSPLNLEMELRIGEMALGAGASVTGITGNIEYDRQEFINLVNQCDTKIARAYTRADSIMEVLSAAYGNAYDTHVKTLEAQDASNRLAGEILLGAALAFIPGGVGGVVGSWMKSAQVGDFLADAIKDMAKAGVKGIQGALPGGGGGGSPMRPMGDDPRTWRAQRAVRVNTEKEHVLDILDNWKTKANSSDPDFYLNFNPVTVTEESLVREGQPLADTPVPDQAEHQKQFELGMWRDWLQTYGYTVEDYYQYPTGMKSRVQENQGKKIRDRINALGENGDQWLETYGGIARRRAEAEAERRNRERDERRYGR